ncbi:hypothetical protein IPA_07965 [Ignicoccus pacificus DSM 13166]|uniref:Preflagellin peptidase FlaK n=1 Tax=Ignicoccus pacificus DSM 13166 TaxID=940294 RepID=A0A977PLX3_9CREN|nr:hypothetical protein IPA_07965 [Ignicoccus pacificus DSM 13166]
MFTIIEWSKLFLALGVMAYAAYQDYKTREIEPKLWLYASVVGAVLTGAELYLFHLYYPRIFAWALIDMLFSFIVFPFLYYMYKIAMLGGADMLAYLFLTFTLPWYPLTLAKVWGLRAISPMPFVVLLYSSILAVIVGLTRLIRNLTNKEFWEYVRERNLSKGQILHYALGGRVFKAKDYLNTKFWYLLDKFEEDEEGLKKRLERRVNLEEEPEDHRKMIRELIESGKIEEHEKVMASYGTPFLVYMFGGLILALILGDFWLRIIFG